MGREVHEPCRAITHSPIVRHLLGDVSESIALRDPSCKYYTKRPPRRSPFLLPPTHNPTGGISFRQFPRAYSGKEKCLQLRHRVPTIECNVPRSARYVASWENYQRVPLSRSPLQSILAVICSTIDAAPEYSMEGTRLNARHIMHGSWPWSSDDCCQLVW